MTLWCRTFFYSFKISVSANIEKKESEAILQLWQNYKRSFRGIYVNIKLKEYALKCVENSLSWQTYENAGSNTYSWEGNKSLRVTTIFKKIDMIYGVPYVY